LVGQTSSVECMKILGFGWTVDRLVQLSAWRLFSLVGQTSSVGQNSSVERIKTVGFVWAVECMETVGIGWTE